MPHALQKCAARISPHDQQVVVASPGMINDAFDFISRFDIGFNWHTKARGRPHCWWDSRGMEPVPPAPFQPQAENELPHPQDFDELGLTKTKPCCISVSW